MTKYPDVSDWSRFNEKQPRAIFAQSVFAKLGIGNRYRLLADVPQIDRLTKDCQSRAGEWCIGQSHLALPALRLSGIGLTILY